MAAKNVSFNYNNGTPIWGFDPDPVHMPPGQDTLTWTLQPNMPSNLTAVFDPSAGVTFKSTSPAWPGTPPAMAADSGGLVYTSSENNIIPRGGATLRCYYQVKVNVSDGTSFSEDPEVDSDPPSA